MSPIRFNIDAIHDLKMVKTLLQQAQVNDLFLSGSGENLNYIFLLESAL
ncbi:hypothetical protein [Bombilactobacillus bombi]|nr:hypothetical protein [Bombilactobacillus bombi]